MRLGVQSSLFAYDDGWERVEGYAPRLLAAVILPPDEKEHLVQDIENSRKSKRRYLRLGVPYHRGYLLYGPPGTGKTSLVSALAANFGLAIYAINLAVFNDRSLLNAVNQISPNSVLLFEDLDCMKSGKARVPSNAGKNDGTKTGEEKADVADRSGVTLSGLLNVLDGFYAPTNVLFMMTTNRIEALDEALLRPGRIDYKLYLGKASDRQKIELYRRFFPEVPEFEAEAFVETCRSAETMAEFQGLLLGLEQEQGGLELVGSMTR
jgi:chaperone BCS1